MANNGSALCYLIVIIVAIGFLVWGFMDILRRKQASEATMNAVISRQIRGFAFIMLAQVILVLGTVICFGLTGDARTFGAKLQSMFK